MKLFKKLFLWCVAILLVVWVGMFFYIQQNGRQLTENIFSRIFKRPVSVGSAVMVPPLGVLLQNVEVQDVLSAKAVHIQLGFPFVLDKQLVVSRLTLSEPRIYVSRGPDARLVLSRASVEPASSQPAGEPSAGAPVVSAPAKSAGIQGIFIDDLTLEGGQVEYNDPSLNQMKVGLERVSVSAGKVSYPAKPVRTDCKLELFVTGENINFAGSRVEGEGWFNFAQKDMDGHVQVAQPNGQVWLKAKGVSQANDMRVEGNIDISQLAGSSAEKKPATVEDFILGAIQSSGMKVGLNFAFRTKMDEFKVESIALAGDVSYDSAVPESAGGMEDLKEIGKSVESFGRKYYEETLQPAGNAIAPAMNAVLPLP